MHADPEFQNPQEIHCRLRDWYLAKLRKEALELSRKAGLTPLSRIHADRLLLEQLVNSSDSPVQEKQKIALRSLPLQIWVGLLTVCFVIMVAQQGVVPALLEFFEATVGVFLFAHGERWKLLEAAAALVFITVPLLFSAICSPHFLFHISAPQVTTTKLPHSKATNNSSIKTVLVRATAILLSAIIAALLWALVKATLKMSPIHMMLTPLVWLCFVIILVNICDHMQALAKALHEQRLAELASPVIATLNMDTTCELSELLTRALMAVTAREYLIADFAGDLTLVLDQELNIRACNQTSVRLLNYLPEELVSRNLCWFVILKDAQKLKSLLAECANGPVTKELCSVSKHGDLVDLSVCFDWSEAQQLYFVMARDISDAKRAERARSEYLTTISHDVRAPLCSVLLGLNSVRSGTYGTVTEESSASLFRAERNVQRIIDLLSETIDLEHSTESDIPLKLEECAFDELVADATEQTKDLADHLNVSIISRIQSHVVRVDRKRILRVLVNLLTNAIKHSPYGGQVIVTSRTELQTIRLEVRDDGPGISPQLSVAVFDRYYQIAEGRGNLSGSGLGLAICKLFVELHGGLIGVSSEPGSGSTLWFSLPTRVSGQS